MRIRIISFTLLMLVSACASSSNDENIKQIEINASNFLVAVSKNDIEKIISFVPKEGLMDADNNVSREEIVSQIKDSNSYLSKRLFTPLNKVVLSKCDPEITSYLPLKAFLEASKANYTITVQRLDNSDFYNLKIDSPRKYKGCKIGVWHTVIKYQKGKMYFESYFFG